MVVKDSYDGVIVIDVIVGILYERDGDWWSNWFLIASRPGGQMQTMMMIKFSRITDKDSPLIHGCKVGALTENKM